MAHKNNRRGFRQVDEAELEGDHPIPEAQIEACAQYKVISKGMITEGVHTGLVCWEVARVDEPDKIIKVIPYSPPKGMKAAVDATAITKAIDAAIGGELRLDLIRRKPEQGAVEDQPYEAWRAPLPPLERARVDRRVNDIKEGDFFVRGHIIDRETGNKVFILSSTDPKEKNQTIYVEVDGSRGINAAQAMEFLRRRNNDVVRGTLISFRADRPNHYKLADLEIVDPKKEAKQRVVTRMLPDAKPGDKPVEAFEWTDNLEDKVDNFVCYDYYRDSAMALGSVINEPGEAKEELTQIAAERFAANLKAVAAARGETIPDEQIEGLWRQVSPQALTPHEILLGREMGPEGQRRVIYSPDNAFERQVPHDKVPYEQLASAAANHAYQSALHSHLVAKVNPVVVNPATGEQTSSYKAKMQAMVASRKLFAENPTLDDAGMEVEGREMAEKAAGKLMKNLMAFGGAQFADPSMDDIDYQGLDTPPRTFEAVVRADLETRDIKAPTENDLLTKPETFAAAAAEMANTTQAQAAKMQSNLMLGKNGILEEQDLNGAVKSPFTRNGITLTKEQIAQAQGLIKTSIGHLCVLLDSLDRHSVDYESPAVQF